MKKVYKVVSFYIATYSSAFAFAGSLSLTEFPLQTTGFVEPNVMFLIDSSGSMRRSNGDGNSRMTVAKQVAREIVNETEDVRFCLSRFNTYDGGRILSECGQPTEVASAEQQGKTLDEIKELRKDVMIQKINSLTTTDWTPLAEAYYEVTRYFQGGQSHYNSGTNYNSPVQYRCQKNFAIVLTDGEPTYDSNFPDLRNPSGTLTANYDGRSPATPIPNTSSSIPHYSDGFSSRGDSQEGSTYYLDDIAKFAIDTDLRDTGLDDANQSFNDSLFSIQNLATYTVSFNPDLDIPMLQDAAVYGNGIFQEAENYTDLKEYFQRALVDITSSSQAVAAATANSGTLSSGFRLYQTRYIGKEWTGQLLAFDVDPTTLQVNPSPTWSASSPLYESGKWDKRVLFTGLRGGRRLKWDNLSKKEKTDFFDNNQDMQRYFRGDNSQSEFRERKSFLGDIVNSSPVLVTAPSGVPYTGYKAETFPAEDYASFVDSKKDRKSMIFVGANDGMLHAFIPEQDKAEEKFAFVPGILMPKLKMLADINYEHKFYVDSTPTVTDVFARFPGDGNRQWKTVLVGGLGRGGQGIYALDITNADQFTFKNRWAKELSLWEFTDADLGFSYSQPQVMRLNDGEFYVVFGSGYNNSQDISDDFTPAINDGVSLTGDAFLYLLNIGTGEIVRKISTEVGIDQDPLYPDDADAAKRRPNGIANVKGLDRNEDGMIDYVYAGDLFGNMWKFDFSDTNRDNWSGEDNVPLKLYSAKDDNGKAQPITTAPEVVKHPDGPVMVYFGTGKLLEESDNINENISTQSFYAIIDPEPTHVLDTSAPLVGGRTNLLEQNITYQGRATFASSDRIVRVTSGNAFNSLVHEGWYLDLLIPRYTNNPGVVTVSNAPTLSEVSTGDQVIVAPQFKDDKIRFITNEANLFDKCLPSSTNFFMELQATTGERLPFVAIDLNGNGSIDDEDGVTDSNGDVVGVSGIAVASNEMPIAVNKDDSTDKENANKEVLIFTTSSDKSGFTEELDTKRFDDSTGQRTSFRELRSN